MAYFAVLRLWLPWNVRNLTEPGAVATGCYAQIPIRTI